MAKPSSSALFLSVKRRIDDNKDQVATALSVSLTTLYWKIGKKINEDILVILPMKDVLKRDFYLQMCIHEIHERWSVRTFRDRVNSMLFERTVISQKPAETISNLNINLNKK